MIIPNGINLSDFLLKISFFSSSSTQSKIESNRFVSDLLLIPHRTNVSYMPLVCVNVSTTLILIYSKLHTHTHKLYWQRLQAYFCDFLRASDCFVVVALLSFAVHANKTEQLNISFPSYYVNKLFMGICVINKIKEQQWIRNKRNKYYIWTSPYRNIRCMWCRERK